MCSSLKKHVSSLDQPLFDEFVAALGCLSRLATSCEEDSALFIFYGHEIGRDLDVDDIGPVAMRPEVVHEQVVCIVNKEVQSIQHFFVVAHQWHLQVLVNNFSQF